MNKRLLRRISVTAVFSAVGVILMLLEFSLPIIPSFVKLDFSEVPALIVSFAFGPLWGVAVCLLKNLLHLAVSQSAGVGELANFLLGCCLVVPAGILYQMNKTRKTAILSSLVGAVLMAAVSLPLNYFVIYPFYENFMPIEAILAEYEAIFPGVDGLFSCLLIFNLPFTFVKGATEALITFLVYKSLSPLLHRIGDA